MADQEKELVEEILKRNGEAIKQLYRHYAGPLLSFIAGRVPKKEDAEEILQDTWLSILDSLPLFHFRSSFLNWAKSIALHEVADFYRKRKIKSIVFSRLPFLENLVSQALGPELTFEEKEAKDQIEKVFTCLSEGYRKILRLKYIEGQSVVEIARTLNLTFKGAESRLFRAKLAFQKAWKENYLESSPVSLSFLALKRRI
jgi:RNA polymerase sigma-70 factor (ECF subfamily)